MSFLRYLLAGLLVCLGTANGRRLVVRVLLPWVDRVLLALPFSTRRWLFWCVLGLPPVLCRPLLALVTTPHGRATGYVKRVHRQDVDAVWLGPRFATASLEDIESRAPDLDLIIMYMHGGGFVTGHAAMYMKCFMALLDLLQGKHGLRAAILSVEYPLGPEAPYPAAIHACVDAYRYLIHTLSVSPTKIVLAGDSAGGALVGTTLHVLANQRDFTEYATLPPLAMPAGSIFLSPWADLRDDVPSYETNRSTDFLSVRGLRGFRAAYLPALAQLDGDQDARDALLADPLVSIRHGKYTGASPVLVAFSKAELLQDGGEMLARQFEAQGVQVDRLCRDDELHVWINEPTFATSLDLWKQDITRIADWINDRLI